MWSEEILEQFILLASENLKGEWVLCGASILPLLGIKTRTTWDIDFYGLNNPSQKETHKLLEIAEALGVPPECINTSGGYYMQKIKNFEKDLILLQESKNAKIYYPNLLLFSQLKLKRFSEVDLQDCKDFYSFNLKQNNPIAKTKLTKELTASLTNSLQPEKAKRIVQYMQFINT